jgi:hypothetical protein
MENGEQVENGEKQGNDNRWLIIIGVIIIILLLVGIGWLAYDRLSGSPAPEPTSLPPSPAPTEPPPAEVQPTASGEIIFQTFAVDRDRITAGECANINWVVKNADLIQLKRDSAVALDQAPASHTHQACLPNPGTYVYRLEASNNAGNSNWMELQVIVDPATGASAPTQAPPQTGGDAPLPQTTGTVTVNYFYVEPERIKVGGCTTVYWDVLNADQIRLLRDEAVVVPNGKLQDSFPDCHNQAAIYKYRLEAENSSNNYNYLELQVIVDP